MTKGYITVKKHMDCMHRVMHHASKCRHVHGHSYLYELTFEFDQLQEIGYSIDFAEIKRVGVQWIEDTLDHGAILNPKDVALVNICEDLDSKIWKMSLAGEDVFCNPSVENIVKEMFLAQEILFKSYEHLRIHHIRVFETPNCYTDCYVSTIAQNERENFYAANSADIDKYSLEKGILEYDMRKLKKTLEEL